MKKILYYDNWDKGYRNFLRLDPIFKVKGFETLLLHTTSFIHKIDEIETAIEGMNLRDISYYKTNKIRNIILKENPSAIVMLNLSFMIDRAIVQICKDLNIKIFHLSHGMLIPSESIQVVKNHIKKSGGNKLRSKLNKKNKYALYNYLVEVNSVSKAFNFFKTAIVDHTKFTQFPKYSSELEVNKSFVFYPSDLKVMVENFGFPKEKIEVVGNPELDAFYISEIHPKAKFCSEELNLSNHNYIAYFDDGLSEEVHGWDSQKWLLFLKDIVAITNEKNHKLIIKLHPRRDISTCVDFFKEHQIKIITDVDFKNFIYHSKFVVSHFSSVLVYALLLNKKIKSPRWDLSENLEEKYPKTIVEYFYDREKFKNTFDDVEVNLENVKAYLDEHVAKVDGKASLRIVDGILKHL
ncbi:MAG: hypothetical protein ABJH82_11900 [Polaribacter sp.]|uniref:hypothetical protein n=1 Tax=Polaribacter sp. TaxID=1920175 RepID=UPI003266EBCD